MSVWVQMCGSDVRVRVCRFRTCVTVNVSVKEDEAYLSTVGLVEAGEGKLQLFFS